MLHRIQRSIQAKLVLPILLSALVVVGLSTVYMFHLKRKNTALAGLTTAQAVVDQVTTLRKFYTEEVVPRAKKAGMKANFDFAEQDNTIPLPATLVKMLGEELHKTHAGTNVRLYSRHPFPHRKATEKYDAFETEAMAAVEQNPTVPFYRLEELDGRLSMRYAIADVMREACIGCHNTHPQSEKTDWKAGDVRGVLEVIVPVEEAAASLSTGTITLVLMIALGLAGLAGCIMFVLRRTVIKPVQALASTSESMARGDLQARATVGSQDEIGTMASGLNHLLDKLVALFQTTQAERDNLQESIQRLLEEVSDVAQGDLTVEAEVTEDATGAIADSFNYMIHQLRAIITQVQNATLQVSASASEVHTTAEQLAHGSEMQAMQIVDSSAAIDEMAVSIEQVSENAVLSAEVAEQALVNARQGATAVRNAVTMMHRMRDQVQETAAQIKALGTRSQEIGAIVRLIGDVADRTSVLALNASIEAALAGEAGQGFAIVAQEVERLAERAGDATKQITSLVSTIQSDTEEAVTAMELSTQEVVQGVQLIDQTGQALEEIESVSTRLAELIQSISLASKQQARGSENLSKAMSEIADVTQQTAAGTKQAAVSINSLAVLAEELRGSVSTFKIPAATRANGHGNGHSPGYSPGVTQQIVLDAYNFPFEGRERDEDC